jgi:hypothetical protein
MIETLSDSELRDLLKGTTEKATEAILEQIRAYRAEIKDAFTIIDGYHNFIVTPVFVYNAAEKWLKYWRARLFS